MCEYVRNCVFELLILSSLCLELLYHYKQLLPRETHSSSKLDHTNNQTSKKKNTKKVLKVYTMNEKLKCHTPGPLCEMSFLAEG